MKTIYIAEVKNADNMTKSARSVLNYISGKYYAVGNIELEDDNCTIFDNCGRGWWVYSDTLVELPIDDEILGTCSNCKHYNMDTAVYYCDTYDIVMVGKDNSIITVDEDFGCNKWECK